MIIIRILIKLIMTIMVKVKNNRTCNCNDYPIQTALLTIENRSNTSVSLTCDVCH